MLSPEIPRPKDTLKIATDEHKALTETRSGPGGRFAKLEWYASACNFCRSTANAGRAKLPAPKLKENKQEVADELDPRGDEDDPWGSRKPTSVNRHCSVLGRLALPPTRLNLSAFVQRMNEYARGVRDHRAEVLHKFTTC